VKPYERANVCGLLRHRWIKNVTSEDLNMIAGNDLIDLSSSSKIQQNGKRVHIQSSNNNNDIKKQLRKKKTVDVTVAVKKRKDSENS
jgi:hypothetical protein